MKTSEVVKKIFIERFELEESQLVPSAKLREDLLLDSMDFIEMIVYIEKKFSIKLNRDELKDISTLEDVNKMVDQTLTNILSNSKNE
jgi:acyl carrier protein